MIKIIKRYRRLYPLYKIVLFDPFTAIHTTEKQIKDFGYRYVENVDMCLELRKKISNKEKHHHYLTHYENSGEYVFLTTDNILVHKHVLGDRWELQAELAMKRKLGKSYQPIFFALCIKKTVTPIRKIIFELIRRKFTAVPRYR